MRLDTKFSETEETSPSSGTTNQFGELNSPGKLTTWSNLGSGGASGGGTKQIRIIPGMYRMSKTIAIK